MLAGYRFHDSERHNSFYFGALKRLEIRDSFCQRRNNIIQYTVQILIAFRALLLQCILGSYKSGMMIASISASLNH